MKLTVLGSGAAHSTGKRNTAGYLIEHNSQFIVFDLGFGTFKFLQRKIDPAKVSAFFFSHYGHADHINDLIALLADFEARKHKNQLTLFGPSGFTAFYQKILGLYPTLFKELPFNVKTKELDNSQVNCFGFCIKTRPIRHSNVESIAFRIEAGGKSIVYTGDADNIDDFLEFAKNADLLICDSSYVHSMKKGTHITSKEAGMLAQSAVVQKLMLSHFFTQTQKQEALSEAGEEFKGKILAASDGLEEEV